MSIATFKDVLAKEKMLEMHSDSDSVEEAKKKKILKRLHPVNAMSSVELYDLSSTFEATSGILDWTLSEDHFIYSKS